MAKPFDNYVAKRLVEEYKKRFQALDLARSKLPKYIEQIQKASEALAEKEALRILQDIPVEEINREKRGFRVKLLKESGYRTVADLAKASKYALASVHGISPESAGAIKQEVNELTSKAARTVKLRLNTDEKTKESSQLVHAISLYKRTKELADAGSELLESNRQEIEYATRDLSAGLGFIKWLFRSKEKKQRTIDAYAYLQGLKESDFIKEVDAKLAALKKVAYQPSSDSWKDFTEHAPRFFTILEGLRPGALGAQDALYGLPEALASEVREEAFYPNGLLCELRRYQEWGVRYILRQGRVLLGDEMGLGKTIQAIAVMVSLRNTGSTHFLVVCPASVITNWCRELGKMSTLSVIKVHGEGRELALESWRKDGGVAVTTYETTHHVALPEQWKIDLMVVDEAHYVKNPEARRSMQVKALSERSERLLFMTGTALENRVEEMVSLIKMLQPEVAEQVRGLESLSSAPQFRELIAPVYYRRRREDVLTELPELIESKEWCNMSKGEEEAYEMAVLSSNFTQARRVSWNVRELRDSSKAKRLLELVEEAESEGRKVIVFSFFLDTIAAVRELLRERCVDAINGSVSPQRRQEIIDEFDKAPAGSVLPAQIQSGGTGLNIQSASVVILCEPQFKPSTENQAISRAYRMGQTRNVLVYRLLCEDTVDEKILALLDAKQELFDAFADESVAGAESLALDEKAFGNIIEEEIRRIRAKQSVVSNEIGG